MHGGRFSATFEAKVLSCDPLKGTVTYAAAAGEEERTATADLVAGADGVRSVVSSVSGVQC